MDKFNVLHWHGKGAAWTAAMRLTVHAVTDAQSFPLELEKLPQLAELGSYGTHKHYSKSAVDNLIR